MRSSEPLLGFRAGHTRGGFIVKTIAQMRNSLYGRPMSVPDEMVEDVTRRFALLADPTRLRILGVLLEREDATVSELAEEVGGAAPNICQHLSRLLSGGVVGRRRDGRTVRYSITDPSIRSLCELVCRSLTESRGAVRIRPSGP